MNPEKVFRHPGGKEEVGIDITQPDQEFFPLTTEQQEILAAHRRVMQSDRGKSHKKLEKRLGQIDFDDIKRNLWQRLRRSGVAPERINFISPEDFLFVGDENYEALKHLSLHEKRTVAMYKLYTNKIYIFLSQFRAESPEKRPFRDINFLASIIHEEIHAVSKNVLFYSFNKNGPRLEATNTGYQITTSTSKTCTLLDEALTEDLAITITIEYLKQHPEMARPEGKDLQQIDTMLYARSGYREAIKFLNTLIGMLAEISGIQPDMVGNALIRSKFRGPLGEAFDLNALVEMDLDGDAPPKKGVPTILPKKILEELMVAKNDEHMQTLTKDLGRHRTLCYLYLMRRTQAQQKISAHLFAAFLKILPSANAIAHSMFK